MLDKKPLSEETNSLAQNLNQSNFIMTPIDLLTMEDVLADFWISLTVPNKVLVLPESDISTFLSLFNYKSSLTAGYYC